MAPDEAWATEGFRLFLSHKSEVKKQTAALALALAGYGIAAFVAHEDIKPTETWQDVIENALHTMDGFVALMTDDFHDSNWTDQEVGFALSRGVPLIAVDLGLKPYGFIGKFQALSSDWSALPGEIAKLLINNPRMLNSYIGAIRNCQSFDEGNKLAELLPKIRLLDEEQVDQLVLALNENGQARYSFGFDGSHPYNYGHGVLPHLHRLSERKFQRTTDKKIELEA
jgi:hypothetical protein